MLIHAALLQRSEKDRDLGCSSLEPCARLRRKQELGKNSVNLISPASPTDGKCLNFAGTPHSGRRNVALASAQIVRDSGTGQSLLFIVRVT
jgi:hypothetical protein